MNKFIEQAQLLKVIIEKEINELKKNIMVLGRYIS